MIEKIAKSLYLYRLQKKSFVLLLGNGASISSGIKPNIEIIKDILTENAQAVDNAQEEQLVDNFNQIWEQQPELRENFANNYLNYKQISDGYISLAYLIKGGYFNPIFSLNFDTLLEDALRKIDFDDFKVIYRSKKNDENMGSLLEQADKKVKIVKLHKNYEDNDFLYTSDDLLNYPSSLESVLYSYFRKKMIVCGYSFGDLNITNVFTRNPQNQDELYYVNPNGKTGAKHILGIEKKRQKCEIVEGAEGTFDYFFSTCWQNIFAQTIQKEYPYPVAKSFVNLKQSQSNIDKLKSLHQLFENAIKFICAIALADYRQVRKKTHGDISSSYLKPFLENIYKIFDLNNAVKFGWQFAANYTSSSFDFFCKPILNFFSENWQDINNLTNEIEAWTEADADEQVYEKRYQQVLNLLQRMDFLQEYVLTAHPMNFPDMDQFEIIALKGESIEADSNVAVNNSEFMLYLDLRSTSIRSKGIPLHPLMLLRDFKLKEGKLTANFYFYNQEKNESKAE
ncbi:SIR2 family protein [candidate division KSB1 bacterium]|nr:SIR2 family protein [candidate division KSB1 bacterium]